MDKLYIGVMSGTSLDAIDIAVCKIDATTCKAFYTQEFTLKNALKEEILHAIQHPVSLKMVGELDVKLGLVFADAINQSIEKFALKKEDIVAVGVHGQTLFHHPQGEYPFSMQLGSGSVIAAHTALEVVTDFRNKDIALGGEGAPFAPAFHQFIFGNLKHKTAVVNIGGMANITLLNADTPKGYDSGCGNVLLDYVTQKYFQKPYDKNGAIAQSGTISQPLLDAMLQDPYFAQQPPKSTGREYFNPKWLKGYLQTIKQSISPQDLLATLTALTAQTIANELTKDSPKEILVCGGGAKNSYLMQQIQNYTQTPTHTTQKYNVDSDFLEAMIFAWLAYKRLHKEKVPLSTITGAKQDTILGCIYC